MMMLEGCDEAPEGRPGRGPAAGSRHAGGGLLLAVDHLSVSFDMYDPHAPYFRAGRVMRRAIDDLSLSVHGGEVLAVVGASGSGKTLLADAVFGLFEPNALVEGRITFEGRELDREGLARVRGRGISLVPQGVANLDPLMRVGEQVVGPRGWGRAARRRHGERLARARELFRAYGLGESAMGLYPFELSGGMARRVLIISALLDDARLIVADEPTPGLDLPLAVRALSDLRAFADKGGGVLLITHDIELALRVADRVAVFHGGTVVEEVPAAAFGSPDGLSDPFTRALWHAMPEHGFKEDPADARDGAAGTGRTGGDAL